MPSSLSPLSKYLVMIKRLKRKMMMSFCWIDSITKCLASSQFANLGFGSLVHLKAPKLDLNWISLLILFSCFCSSEKISEHHLIFPLFLFQRWWFIPVIWIDYHHQNVLCFVYLDGLSLSFTLMGFILIELIILFLSNTFCIVDTGFLVLDLLRILLFIIFLDQFLFSDIEVFQVLLFQIAEINCSLSLWFSLL